MPSGTGEAKGGWVLARWGDSGSHPRRTITCDGMDRFLVNTEVVAYILRKCKVESFRIMVMIIIG